MELIAEAYTISEKTGVGQELVYEFIKGKIFPHRFSPKLSLLM